MIGGFRAVLFVKHVVTLCYARNTERGCEISKAAINVRQKSTPWIQFIACGVMEMSANEDFRPHYNRGPDPAPPSYTKEDIAFRKRNILA